MKGFTRKKTEEKREISKVPNRRDRLCQFEVNRAVKHTRTLAGKGGVTFSDKFRESTEEKKKSTQRNTWGIRRESAVHNSKSICPCAGATGGEK